MKNDDDRIRDESFGEHFGDGIDKDADEEANKDFTDDEEVIEMRTLMREVKANSAGAATLMKGDEAIKPLSGGARTVRRVKTSNFAVNFVRGLFVETPEPAQKGVRQTVQKMDTSAECILKGIKQILEDETGRDYFDVKKSENGSVIIQDLYIYLDEEDNNKHESLLGILKDIVEYPECNNFEKTISKELLQLHRADPKEFREFLPLDV